MLHQEANREVSRLVSKGIDEVRKSRTHSPFLGVTTSRNGVPENSIALKFIMADGKQTALHYHDILSPLDYDGATKICLTTLRMRVTIEGVNLEELFDYILEHRVKWISEPQSSFDEVEEGKVIVSSIHFESVQ